MGEDVATRPEEELSMEEISSPVSVQLLEYYTSELFPETVDNSEPRDSCPNRNSYEENYDEASFGNLLEKDTDIQNIYNNNNNNSNENLSAIFDTQDEIDDISASIDFSTSSPFYVDPPPNNSQSNQLNNFLSSQPQIPLNDVINGTGIPSYPNSNIITGNLLGPTLPSIIEDSVSSPACSNFLGPTNPTVLPVGNMNLTFCTSDGPGNFSRNFFMSGDLMMQPQDFDCRGDNNGGFYYPDTKLQIFNPGDMQALSIESQNLLHGHANTPPTPLPQEISAFEDPTLKVGKLSSEERKEKINRYLRKRNERNFSKKIKYACRKTLADSRPRVRGRFAKNDELGESQRLNSSSHEEDDDEEVGVKEEDDTIDSSDIFAHISGVNSFKYTAYPIQSWI